ncbi:MAG: UPF0147 family protein [Candidatus Nanoarchaeia archaeon]
MTEMMQDVIQLLCQIEEDYSVPKNIRCRIKTAIDVLSEDGTLPGVKASKAIEELEAASDETNLPTYTRTQIWQVVSLLESTI